MLQRFFTVLAFFLAFPFLLHAQDPITLRFTGQDQHGRYVPLNSVYVENLTKRWQEVLYYPDTVLNIGDVGIAEPDLDDRGVRLFQNVPNPFIGVTDFALQLSDASVVQLEIHDLNGRMEASYKGMLDQGMHQFRAWLATPQTYLLNARTEKGAVQIMMVNAGHAGQSRIEYTGKGGSLRVDNLHNGSKGNSTMPFNYGDTLSYQGTAHLADHAFTSASVVKAQYGSDLIPLVFTLPLPTVTTEAATGITPTSAQLNGAVVEDDQYPVTERGFLFAENEPLNGAVECSAGSGGGQFHYAVTNLQLASRYYYRAYARTAMGTTYGDVLYFDTHEEFPEVHTLDVTNVTATTATCGGNVTASGGGSVIARGVCWSTSPNPTVNDSHTSDGSGLGLFTSYLLGLTANTTYYARAYATNGAGTDYGEQRIFTTLDHPNNNVFYCGIDSLMDYDGNVYHTVEIGHQCWTRENLRTTHYSDGTAIPLSSSTSVTNSTPYRYAPDGNSGNVPVYGYWYNWSAVMHGSTASNAVPSGVQGVCPSGWHVPSYAEFWTLVNYVGSQSQYACDGDSSFVGKALASSAMWGHLGDACSPGYDHPSNNATGFTALPAGYRCVGNSYMGSQAFFCHTGSSSGCFNVSAWIPQVRFTILSILSSAYAGSVRCVLDDSGVDSSTAIMPVVTTETLDDIYSTTATCTGVVTASGGAGVTVRGVCWSTLPNPTVNDSHTNDGIGTGRFTSNITGLASGTTYYVRTYATNIVGTAYGEERTITTYFADSCGGLTVADCDGNVYHTVPIGQQCWMRENLRTTHYADGTAIAFGSGSSTSTPYLYAPNGQDITVPEYGYLYNWVAAMHGAASSETNPSGVQGVCPTGWHLPSNAEWLQLIYYVRGHNEYSCGGDSTNIGKSLASTKGWSYSDSECAVGHNPNTNNATRFSALPAGYTGSSSIHEKAIFWTTTQSQGSSTFYAGFGSEDLGFWGLLGGSGSSFGLNLSHGASVRCLRD